LAVTSVTSSPGDGEFPSPSIMRAGSSTTSLATGRVISEVEVRIWAALLTPS
ncbi:hypothetical protein T08_990, partial [Trichinella sp. T8]